MSGQLDNLYEVQKKDIPKAGVTLADAFQNDPLWSRFLKDEAKLDERGGFFEAPIRYCFKYGEVYATSERLEGIAVWVPGDLADMTIWRLIQSGAIVSGLGAMRVCTKLVQQQVRILGPLEADRKANMKGRAYIYLMIIGVATQFQGQGLGGKLLRAVIEKGEQMELPIYVETETEKNIRMYENLGFRQIKQVTLPIVDLPQWELIRIPETWKGKV